MPTSAAADPSAPEPGIFHPSRGLYRGVVLVVVGLIVYGSYFAYDSIGALAPILVKAWHTGQDSIGSLYTMIRFSSFRSSALFEKL